MMSHTATTTVSRYFTKSRGRALSICWFGLSSAEFIMPVLMVFLLSITTWQNIWTIIAIIILFFLPIASFFLVKKVNLDTREKTEGEEFKEENIKQWKRIEVLKDYKFYIVSMNMLAMPWIATGVFVYQSFISSSKNWGPFVIAQSFMSYSVFSVLTLLISGFLIDKFTSRKLLIFMNIPLFLSTFVIIYFNAPITAFVFLGCLLYTSPSPRDVP